MSGLPPTSSFFADSAETLLQTMPLSVLALAPDGTVALLNPEAETLWGVPRSAILGQQPDKVQPAVLPPDLLQALTQRPAPVAEYWLPQTSQWIALRMASAPDGHTWVYWDNVTAQRQLQEAQDQRAASAALLRATEEVAHTGSYEADLATMSFHFSDGMSRLFGEDPQSFVLTTEFINSRSLPADVLKVQLVLDQAVLNRSPYYYTRRIHRSDGQLRTMESHGQVVCDATGKPVKLLGQVQDVTERKAAEAKLAQATHTIQRMLNGSLAAIVLLDALRDEQGQVIDFVFRGANKASTDIILKTKDQLLGKRLLEEFPGVRSIFFDHYRQVMDTGQTLRMETYYPLDQINAWLDVTATRNADGLILTFLDITERKQAEAELRKQYQILQQAEEVARMGSWEYNSSSDTLRWSEGMYQLFGLPPGSPVQPETYLDFVLEEDLPIGQRLVAKLRAVYEPLDETLRIRVQEQVLTLRVKAITQQEAPEHPLRMLGVDLDITEIRRLEADNLHLRLQQQRARFDAVLEAQETERTRIAEGLHNGVGQLLYAIKLHLTQLRLVPSITTWDRADALLAEAIDQTRTLSHELIPMVLTEGGLSAALLDICRQLSTQQLRFVCHIVLDPPPLPALLQVALFRIAQELALNVVKHANATEASIALETVPGFVLLRAEDNGVGFPSNPLDRAGIGLRAIRERVNLLGGTLDVGSSRELGTYVRLRIPVPPSN